jgi:hypothetical protein
VSIDRLPGKIEEPVPEIRKGRLDLLVLRAMARKIVVTLHSPGLPAEVSQPLSYAFEEPRGRQHRMLVFAPRELLTLEEMRFVGFVSRRKQEIEPHIIDELFRADELMLTELTRIPGLLSYSSLELRPGNWYNLVLFRDESVKTHVKHVEAHRHAAHILSPAYYEWIRLHNGSLAHGLPRAEWQLKTTRQYRFPGAQQPPVVRELQYEPCTGAR